jgi:hypothetical protein
MAMGGSRGQGVIVYSASVVSSFVQNKRTTTQQRNNNNNNNDGNADGGI